MMRHPKPITGVPDGEAEKYAALLFCSLLAFSVVLSAFTTAARSFIANTGKLDTLFVYLCLAFLVMKALPQLTGAIHIRDIVFFLFGVSVCLLSRLFNRYDPVFQQVWLDAILTCVPAYFTALAVRDYAQLMKYLRITAYVILFCLLLKILIAGAGSVFSDGRTYSQSFGYNVLPAAVILLVSLYKRFNAWDLPGFVTACVLTLLSGARGPIVCVIGVGVLLLLFGDKNAKSWKKYLWIMVCATLAAVVMLNQKSLLARLIPLFSQWGLSTRTLLRLQDATFISRTGRENITKYVLTYIGNHPLLGCGVLQDRVLIARYVYGGTFDAIGTYPHNFFLELIMQFGVVIGGGLIVFFMKPVIKAIWWTANQDTQLIALILSGIGLLPLMWSNSYISHPPFYMLMGFCIGIGRQRRLPRRQMGTVGSVES